MSLVDEDGRDERVDLPMRAFAGGYYRNLRAMYDHLGVRYQAKRFLFAFSEPTRNDPDAADRPYFVHSSNNHRIPPIRPAGMSRVRHLLETVFLLVCYLWLTICCFLFRPGPNETFGQWARRMWLPSRLVSHYALPLFCAVATCSHEQLLDFPASDLVSYKKLTQSADHFVVTGGVHNAQRELADGLRWRLNAEVLSVEPQDEPGTTKVVWKRTGSSGNETETDTFHHVVLAVSPDLVGKIFPKLRKDMSKIPTTLVDNLVLQPQDRKTTLRLAERGLEKSDSYQGRVPQREAGSELITLRSNFGDSAATEAWHTVNCGAVVRTTNTISQDPLQASNVLHRWLFRRVLRTPESQKIVNRILRLGEEPQQQLNLGISLTAWTMFETAIRSLLNIQAGSSDLAKEKKVPSSSSVDRLEEQTISNGGPGPAVSTHRHGDEWTDGDDGVWIVGGWAWDGMVLLEGCVTSAMRVARRFDVDIPWEESASAVDAGCTR